MNKRWLALIFAATFLCSALASAATLESETITVGRGVLFDVVDPVTGRVFTANAGVERFGPDASIGVLEPDGTTKTLKPVSAPIHLAVSKTFRKVIVSMPNGSWASLVDADTLEQTIVPTGWGSLGAVVVESLGRAYMYGQNSQLGGPPPWLNPGGLNGTLTEIDLRTNQTQTFQVSGMQPMGLVANEAGTRLYVTGRNYFRTGEAMPGFVQVFDIASRSFLGTPQMLGRLPVDVTLSASGSELYVLGHIDKLRPEFAMDTTNYTGILPAVFVLDAASLQVKSTIPLPDSKDLVMQGGQLLGRFDLDPESGRLYVLDIYNSRFTVVDPADGSTRAVDLEGWAKGIAYDRVSKKLIVSMPYQGYAAIFSPSGERLDTVPTTRPSGQSEIAGSYTIAINPVTGVAYSTNGHDASVTILRAPAASAVSTLLNVTDLWWNPDESGWGLFLDQQGTTLFGALFLQDAQGAASWYVMSGGQRQKDGSFLGLLARTSGPASQALANLANVGSLRFAPNADGSAALSYEIKGAGRATNVSRLKFAQADRTCRWTVDASPKAAATANHTSLWFDPTQPGWGVAVSHRGDTIFGVLFSYDAQNSASWAAMSDGGKQADGSFAGTLYRSAAGGLRPSGTMGLSFATSEEATLTYDDDGAKATRSMRRMLFAPVVSDCSGP